MLIPHVKPGHFFFRCWFGRRCNWSFKTYGPEHPPTTHPKAILHRIRCLGTIELEHNSVHYWFMNEISLSCHQYGQTISMFISQFVCLWTKTLDPVFFWHNIKLISLIWFSFQVLVCVEMWSEFQNVWLGASCSRLGSLSMHPQKTSRKMKKICW